MKIYKQYKGEKKQELTTEAELIKHCEGSGHWKPGTALQILKEIGTIQTPFAIYTTK